MSPTDAPACHVCGAEPVVLWHRRATDTEAQTRLAEVALLQGRTLAEVEVEQRYGPAVVAVTGCAVHHLGDDSEDLDSGVERRALLHDADCGGHGGCVCE